MGAQRYPQQVTATAILSVRTVKATAVLSVRTVVATRGVSSVPTATIVGDVLNVYDVKIAMDALTAWIALIVRGVLEREV